MQVLSVASEVYPLIKTGGLADVAGALPQALAAQGVAVTTLLPGYREVIGRLVDGTPTSLEHSRLPFGPRVADLTAEGLVDGSLTASLVRRGVVVDRFEEWARVSLLTAAEADALGRQVGEPWLQLFSVGRDAAGDVVEFVTSWLDPAHFHLHHDSAGSPGGGPGRG